jgi:hypothetical protein
MPPENHPPEFAEEFNGATGLAVRAPDGGASAGVRRGWVERTKAAVIHGLTLVAVMAAVALDGLSARAASLVLRWQDNSDNETGFKIERRPEGGGFAEIATVAANTTTFTDAGLEPAATYGYRVRAFNAWGDSGYSNIATAATAPPPDTPPTLGAIGTQTAAGDGIFEPIVLELGDRESDLGSLAVTAVCSDPALVPHEGILVGWDGGKWTLTIRPAAGRSGTAVITVTVSDGWSSASRAFGVSVLGNAPGVEARLLNLSTRVLVGPDDRAHHLGFVLSGGDARQMLLRAVGPTLALAPIGLSGVLPDPTVHLGKNEGGISVPVAANDDWFSGGGGPVSEVSARVGAFPLAHNAEDAALVAGLTEGIYTMRTSDEQGRTGIALSELYVVDDTITGPALVNMSSLGFVGTGSDVSVVGFVLGPEGSRTLLLRAIGPTLAAPPFGLAGMLEDPSFAIYRHGAGSAALVFACDDWPGGTDAALLADTARKAGAFPLLSGSRDAAAVVTLPAGVYTIVVRGAGEETGRALIEIYTVVVDGI